MQTMSDTSTDTKPLTAGERKDLRVLALFTDVWCRVHHSGEKEPVAAAPFGMEGAGIDRFRYCPECREFLAYAMTRRLKCPLDPKPSCKHCHLHCYRPGHREQVRQIMRFAGPYLIKRGRIDLLWHYFF